MCIIIVIKSIYHVIDCISNSVGYIINRIQILLNTEVFYLLGNGVCTPEQLDLAVKASRTGREQVIFSQKDRSRIGKAVVVAANEALVKEVAPELPDSLTDSKVGAFLGKMVNSATAQITGTGLLTLSEETRPIRGGFILVDGPVEVNCSFESMLRLQREKLEKPAAEILFGA